MSRDRLLQRLDAIGRSLEGTGSALALLALGSVGTELDRIDAYSDLDFFVVVRDGYKQEYLDDLGWLSSVQPIAYSFLNTPDGYKVLFDDGIYGEFAVFTLAHLEQIVFPEARIVWKAAGVDDAIRFPRRATGQGMPPTGHTLEWLIGEALTNLYVGLGRYHRGERLSAVRLIQFFAVDRVLELARLVEEEQVGPTIHRDAFASERRFEQRFPVVARELPNFMQGYDRTPESTAAILAFLERHWEVNPAMARAIRQLLPAYLATAGDGGNVC